MGVSLFRARCERKLKHLQANGPWRLNFIWDFSTFMSHTPINLAFSDLLSWTIWWKSGPSRKFPNYKFLSAPFHPLAQRSNVGQMMAAMPAIQGQGAIQGLRTGLRGIEFSVKLFRS